MNRTEDLAAKIERLVADHVAELRRGAAEAVERAFAGGSVPPRRKVSTTSPPKGAKRRDPGQIAELAERLHAAVCETPGESMAVLAERVGATARELNRPMNNLRKAGRLRSVGTRSSARYFPAVGRAANSRA